MDAITFLRNKGILGEIHTKWMITFSDGSQVDLVQLFDEFAALRQPAVMGRSEQLFCPDCKSKARMQNGFIWCENDDCGGIYRAKQLIKQATEL